LVASLALNLLILGAVAGSMYMFGKHPSRHGFGHAEDFGLMGLTRSLPADRRKELRKELREDRANLRPLANDVRAARRDAADKLAAEPFDRAALEGAIATAAEKERTLRAAAVAAFLGHAEKLSAEERQKLADWWRKKNEPFKGRRSRDGAEKSEPAEEKP
jgi:uncharacterized membrane protein